MKTITKNYQEQAEKFLESVGATMKVAYVRNGKYFDDDKDNRDVQRLFGDVLGQLAEIQ